MNFRMEHKLSKIIAAVVALSLALSGLGYFYFSSQQQLQIYEFENQRDTPFIKELFKNDWYWLVAGISDSYDSVAENYVENMLATRLSSTHKRPLTLKVVYENNKPVGFLAYFIKKFYLGKILFVDVLPEYRSKGWGAKLMKYAMDDLIKRGVSQIELVTRTNNDAAQKLYTRLGFHETERDDEFVSFAYQVPQ